MEHKPQEVASALKHQPESSGILQNSTQLFCTSVSITTRLSHNNPSLTRLHTGPHAHEATQTSTAHANTNTTHTNTTHTNTHQHNTTHTTHQHNTKHSPMV